MSNRSRIYQLNILADTRGLNEGLDKAKKQVNDSQTAMSQAFDKAKVALLAATAAAGAYAIKLAVDGVKAAIEDTAAQERLANALRNTTAASDAQIRSVEDQILKLSLATGVADDQLRPAFQRLATATGDLGQSQSLLNLALDISAATGKSVESVTNALGRAYEGSTTALTRLGVGLSAAEIETLGLEGAIGQLSQTFGGAAAVQAETLEGQIQRLKVSFDETKESIGAALLPILTDLFTEFADFAIPAAEKFADVFQNDLVPYLQNQVFPAFGDLIDSLQGIGDAFNGVSADTEDANILFEALQTTIVEFVPVTVGAIGKVADVWATFVDILRRGVAFIQGDLATATAQWNNRFAETEKVTNNVSAATIRAYKEFEFWNKQTRDQTIPNVTRTNDAVNELSKSLNSKSTAVRKVAADIDILYNATDRYTRKTKEAKVANDNLNNSLKESNRIAEDVPTSATDSRTGSSVGAGGMNPLIAQLMALKGSGGTVQDLVNQFTGTGLGLTISTSNLIRNASDQLLTDMYEVILAQVSYQDLIDRGLGNLNLNTLDRLLTQTDPGFRVLPGTRIGQASLTLDDLVNLAKPVTINVNGTVLDPEGTARAVQQVIQDSNARSGFQSLTPVLGLE